MNGDTGVHWSPLTAPSRGGPVPDLPSGDRSRIEIIWPVADALEVFGCRRVLVELQQSAVFLQQRRADLGRGREEEFPAFIDEVDSAAGEPLDIVL